MFYMLKVLIKFAAKLWKDLTDCNHAKKC